MTTQTPAGVLALRCEAATGADRELDRDIMLFAVPCDRAPFRYWMPMNENTGHGAVDVERVYYGPHCGQAVAVPAYTASLDAAMTLGDGLTDQVIWEIWNEALTRCSIAERDIRSDLARHWTAAALRARARAQAPQ